jgi:hypothetical protein
MGSLSNLSGRWQSSRRSRTRRVKRVETSFTLPSVRQSTYLETPGQLASQPASMGRNPLTQMYEREDVFPSTLSHNPGASRVGD